MMSVFLILLHVTVIICLFVLPPLLQPALLSVALQLECLTKGLLTCQLITQHWLQFTH